MATLPIVEHLDELEDRGPCLGWTVVVGVVDELGLQRSKEALHDGVVPAVGAPARDMLNGLRREFLLDATVFPGNSGGPVLSKPEIAAIGETKPNLQCKLIGVVRAYVPYQDMAYSRQTGRPRVIFEENSGLTEVLSVDLVDQVAKLEHERMKAALATARESAQSPSHDDA